MASGTFKSETKSCVAITSLAISGTVSASASDFTFTATVTGYQSLSSIVFHGGDGQTAAVTLDASPTGTAPSIEYDGNAASITYAAAGDYYPYLVVTLGNGEVETIYPDRKFTIS